MKTLRIIGFVLNYAAYLFVVVAMFLFMCLGSGMFGVIMLELFAGFTSENLASIGIHNFGLVQGMVYGIIGTFGALWLMKGSAILKFPPVYNPGPESTKVIVRWSKPIEGNVIKVNFKAKS